MSKSRIWIAVLALAVILPLDLFAQFPGGQPGGFRGGQPGGQPNGQPGGFRGGTPGSGTRGDAGSSNRGSFQNNNGSGQRGGFPGGGFPNGGFQPGGFQGGGDRSSQFNSSNRGGTPGGDRSQSFSNNSSRSGTPGSGDRGQSSNNSRGGPPGSGGFDPREMLSRLDANRNGSIDPDEMQGPARFMLDRISGNSKEIASAMQSSRPIPLSLITKELDKMRGDSGRSSNGSSNSGPSNSSSSQASVPEPLVPAFGVKKEVVGIMGFGVAGSSAASVKVEEEDVKDATERLQRYDKNRDGVLDERELKEWRSSDSPLLYDRNGDKKISLQELSVRYAKRRMAEDAERANRKTSNDRGNNRDGDRGEKVADAPLNPWNAQASYKITSRYGATAKTQGIPEWFASSDANSDGQVMMNEYASNWDEATLQEFARFDANKDGTITTLETLEAVKKGVLRGASGSVTVAPTGSTSSSSSSSASTKPSAAELDRSDLPADAEERWVQYSALQIKKSDKDNNSRLTPDEWAASNGDFGSVDKNGDGSISLGEFYNFRKKK